VRRPQGGGEGEEEEGDDFVVPEEEDLPEEILTGAALAAAQAESKAAQERFAEELKARSKEAADMFDEMVVHEERIRLGDPGWKGRYYEVRPCPKPVMNHDSIMMATPLRHS
jgi:hypothetical protein